jgi:hypothetical protein
VRHERREERGELLARVAPRRRQVPAKAKYLA